MCAIFQFIVLIFVCCLYINLCSAHGDDCENKIYTDEIVTLSTSKLECQGHTFSRNAGFRAAYDCCSARKQNIHCRFVCLLRSIKWLKLDGTLSKGRVIRDSIKDYGDVFGVDYALETIDCFQRYGPYKPSENCHDIEKHLTCLEDIALRECKVATTLFLNNQDLEDGSVRCRGKNHHWPTLFLEHNKECLRAENSTYMQYKCLWLNTGMHTEDHNMNINGALHWHQLVYGRAKGQNIFNSIVKYSSSYDLPKLWAQAKDDNVIDILAPAMADIREAFYAACGAITTNFINGID